MNEEKEIAIQDFEIERIEEMRGKFTYGIRFTSSDKLSDEDIISFIPVLYEWQQKKNAYPNPPQRTTHIAYRKSTD